MSGSVATLTLYVSLSVLAGALIEQVGGVPNQIPVVRFLLGLESQPLERDMDD